MKMKLWGLTALNAACSLAVAMLLCAAATERAHAVFIEDIQQVGSDVVVTGTGGLTLSGLIFVEQAELEGGPGMTPSSGILQTGPLPNALVEIYTGFTGPSNFGTGATTFGSSGTGDVVAISDEEAILAVPAGYAGNGAPLSSSATFDNQTFASLGLTPGLYTYSWTPFAIDPSLQESFVIDVIAPDATTPLPAALPLFAGGLGFVGFLTRRKKKTTAA